MLSLALAYRGLWLVAFAVAGLLFNIHALTSTMRCSCSVRAMLADFREIGWRAWVERAGLATLVAVVLASPTLKLMADTRQTFNADWVKLMQIRSADHSFPSTWWSAGDPDIPRFTLLLALFVLSWSFTPVRRAAEASGGGKGHLRTNFQRPAMPSIAPVA